MIATAGGRIRVVVIGGGTGSYKVLRGLKSYPLELAAHVSMLDAGGSSGRLRNEFEHLPPGGGHRCLLALAADDDTGWTLCRLFDFRLERGSGLNGHSVGNLLLTALTEISGDLEGAIRDATRLLNVRGESLRRPTARGRVIRGGLRPRP